MIKKIIYRTGISFAAFFWLTACDTFLDEMPDRRTEIDTNSKVGELLVSAYPTVDPMMIYEHRTDNAMDNGKQYGIPDQTLVENYHWDDISDTSWDGPEMLWNGCYSAIAAANQALEAIEQIGESSENRPFKGEALLCRAYAHFLLVNTFCQPYNASTAGNDLGIPYVEKPETVVGTTYERGTVQTVYEKLAADIETGYPLINDHAYKVTHYHFNKKAASAFAARFYLFYGKYDLALRYADMTIETDPSANLRDLKYYQSLTSISEWRDRFISKDEPANIMLVALRSRWGRTYRSQRYGVSTPITSLLTYRSSGPWGNNALPDMGYLWSGSGSPIAYQPKYNEIFEITNQTARTGQPHVVQMAFTVDETLMCRAEANIMLKNYEAAAQDLSYWYVKKGGKAATAEQIVAYYNARATSEQAALAKGELSPWLVMVKPFHTAFTVEAGTQERMLQGVLHARRIETMYSGLRWLDIRRYGIEVIHNVDEGTPMTLAHDDLRRVIQIPKAVISAGLPPNPR